MIDTQIDPSQALRGPVGRSSTTLTGMILIQFPIGYKWASFIAGIVDMVFLDYNLSMI